ncbi:hypothetical protein CYMTET_45090 [Cymbomonas tetramitiformis]|uniref:Uncharacterized protein n=1 Tax=Cymbomonas tetramitiformis TaxID=36881 RepID=A0AAE0BYX3_9CHLO|nr:hypothetical protein CYMTET_45090 [Cymbomonas tetramitiformis]
MVYSLPPTSHPFWKQKDAISQALSVLDGLEIDNQVLSEQVTALGDVKVTLMKEVKLLTQERQILVAEKHQRGSFCRGHGGSPLAVEGYDADTAPTTAVRSDEVENGIPGPATPERMSEGQSAEMGDNLSAPTKWMIEEQAEKATAQDEEAWKVERETLLLENEVLCQDRDQLLGQLDEVLHGRQQLLGELRRAKDRIHNLQAESMLKHNGPASPFLSKRAHTHQTEMEQAALENARLMADRDTLAHQVQELKADKQALLLQLQLCNIGAMELIEHTSRPSSPEAPSPPSAASAAAAAVAIAVKAAAEKHEATVEEEPESGTSEASTGIPKMDELGTALSDVALPRPTSSEDSLAIPAAAERLPQGNPIASNTTTAEMPKAESRPNSFLNTFAAMFGSSKSPKLPSPAAMATLMPQRALPGPAVEVSSTPLALVEPTRVELALVEPAQAPSPALSPVFSPLVPTNLETAAEKTEEEAPASRGKKKRTREDLRTVPQLSAGLEVVNPMHPKRQTAEQEVADQGHEQHAEDTELAATEQEPEAGTLQVVLRLQVDPELQVVLVHLLLTVPGASKRPTNAPSVTVPGAASKMNTSPLPGPEDSPVLGACAEISQPYRSGSSSPSPSLRNVKRNKFFFEGLSNNNGGAVGQGDETAQKGRISMARSVHSNWQQKEAAIQAARVTQLFAERNEFAERNQDLQDELAKLRAETTAQLQAVQKQNEELRANHEKLMQRIPLWKQQELFPEDDPNIELLHDLDAAPYATD